MSVAVFLSLLASPVLGFAATLYFACTVDSKILKNFIRLYS
jgi:hypothetical protein